MIGMDNEYLLSICVPTYNGASSYLCAVLDTLSIITSKYKVVEVIISDNCSTDHTKDIVQNYTTSNFIYYRNAANLGFNGNMLKLAREYSKGQYLWFVGDDDIVNLSFIDGILKELSSARADFYVLNYRDIISIKDIINGESADEVFHYGTYAQAIDRNCEHGNAFATFMGSAICNREQFCSVDISMIDTSFDKFYNIFPNAYIAANAFYDKKCGYTDGIGIYPIYRNKAWNDSDNSYRLNSHIVMDFYKYLLHLGIPSNSLTNTYERVLYLNIETGLTRIRSCKSVSLLFWRCLLRSVVHPRVIIKVFKLIFKVK